MAGRIFSLPMDPHIKTVPRRKTLEKIAVAVPLFTIAAVSSFVILIRRMLGYRHPHAWSLHEELQINFMRTLLICGDIGVWRAFFRNVSSRKKTPREVVVTPVERPGSKSLWFELQPELRPAQPRSSFTLVFVHGGAFAAGSARQYQLTYAAWLKRLAKRGLDCRILSVEYPLSPEHRYPAGRDECEAEIAWILSKESGETRPVIVGGDSAGANLALVALAHLRDTSRLPRTPEGLLLISPCIDLSDTCVIVATDEGAMTAGGMDYLPKDKLALALPHMYAEDMSDPYVSPINLASLDGLVSEEIMLVSGGAELMIRDIRAFAKRMMAEADVVASRVPSAPSLASSLSEDLSAVGDASDSEGGASYGRCSNGSGRFSAAGRGSSITGSGSGFRACYLEEPGRVHSWPVLMIPNLWEAQEPIFKFMERMSGL